MNSKPEFFGNPFGSEVELPEELLNEPYSYEDNGLRPDVVKERPRFLFRIQANGDCYFNLGTVTYQPSRSEHRNQVPEKSSTTVSVVTVYDTYGLDVVYAYLKYLYTDLYTSDSDTWLTTYLRGSLAVLRPDALSRKVYSDDILSLASLIFLDLAYLDSTQPKVHGSPTTVAPQLPPELLSMLLASDRIAKSVTSSRMELRCDKIPTTRELMAANTSIVSPICLLPTGEYIKIINTEEFGHLYYILTYREDSWVFEAVSVEREELDLTDAEIVGHPIQDYDKVFFSRGCSTLDSSIPMLEDVLIRMRRATVRSLPEVCSWYMSLVWGFEDGEVEEIGSFESLKAKLIATIEHTIRTWSNEAGDDRYS
ncbi:Hypothetical protein POVR2_LOCUS179 [uncultured virus]|nr:Hypothetical protein POVR2_LOCUS179 [uncultured virus]